MENTTSLESIESIYGVSIAVIIGTLLVILLISFIFYILDCLSIFFLKGVTGEKRSIADFIPFYRFVKIGEVLKVHESITEDGYTLIKVLFCAILPILTVLSIGYSAFLATGSSTETTVRITNLCFILVIIKELLDKISVILLRSKWLNIILKDSEPIVTFLVNIPFSWGYLINAIATATTYILVIVLKCKKRKG